MYRKADMQIKKALLSDYVVYVRDDHYIITCDQCSARWSLARKQNVHVGNLLHLLDHARSHSVRANGVK